ncbi:MAG: NAD(P)H-hydrate dehydratase [Alphaproteobacteria bacterium]|nr:NAD(P)H-hydrate dehydratase [Alphaproteobacteria bacterium]
MGLNEAAPPAMGGRSSLLTVEEMGLADRLAAARGHPGFDLMRRAGAAVTAAVRRRWSPRPTLVLAGPGNNGGDGFIVAARLRAAGWPVRVALQGSRAALAGDAAEAAKCWSGPVEPLEAAALGDAGLVIDALFGAGLKRPVSNAARETLEAAQDLPLVAVDLPSGLAGDSGVVLGYAPCATLTVTFFRKKPGHLLLPGRLHCGEIVVADIGIPEAVLDEIRPISFENGPGLWVPPTPDPESHKYTRGHAVIWGGAEMTGAARLAARGAMRAGAGLVTVSAPDEAWAVYAASLPGALVVRRREPADFRHLLEDARKNAVLVGPGAGLGPETVAAVQAACAGSGAVVLDADALTAMAGHLPEGRGDAGLLTPHDGEFARLFRFDGDRLARARAAAAASGWTVLLKGADSVVAAPDGRAAISANAPPWLATAGSGDVLAGMALGLMAQGMPAFEAAAAATWLHGEAATAFGPGLIAEDLPDMLPPVLHRMHAI